MLCPKCNAILNEGDKFCHVCGLQLPEASAGPSSKEESTKEEKFNAQTFTDIKSEEVFSNVKRGNFFRRMLFILIKPSSEWLVISKEKPRVAMMIFGYLLVFGIVAFIAKFFGDMLYLLRFGTSYHELFIISIFNGIKIVGLIATPFIAAIIINSILPAFKMEKNFGRVMQLTTYSFTPVLLSWTLFLIPFTFIIYFVHLISLYGIIIFLSGYKKILNPPHGKEIGLFFASAGILYGVYYTLYFTIQFMYPIFWRFDVFPVIPH